MAKIKGKYIDYDTNTLEESGDSLAVKDLGYATGAASSTDDAIPTFNGTDGKVLQDSGLICVDDKIYQEGYSTTYIKFNNGSIEIWAGGVKQAAW